MRYNAGYAILMTRHRLGYPSVALGYNPHTGEYVTWRYDCHSDQFDWGHYFPPGRYAAAFADFLTRCPRVAIGRLSYSYRLSEIAARLAEYTCAQALKRQ